MSTLCITGIPGRDFETISKLLFNAGLAEAKPIERETTISIHDWHKRAAPLLRRQQPPGRLWEQLAGDLLLANLHETQWGWADTASLDALEFWAELEPGLNFLLLTSEPEDYLAHCMLEGSSETGGGNNEQAHLKRWRDHHERMLEFYLDNPERCLLVNARQSRANPEALSEKLAERFGVELEASVALLPVIQGEGRHNAPESLAYYIAEKAILDKGKELAPLRDEVLAAQYPLEEPDAEWDKEGNIVGTAKLSLTSILRDYQQRCAQDLTESERQALKQLRKENEELLKRLRSVQEQLEETTANQKALEQELAATKALPVIDPKREAELEEQKEENQLLLLQLQQVQEELEAVFIKERETSNAKIEKERAVEAATTELDQLKHQLARQTREIEDLQQKLAQRTTQTEELENLLSQGAGTEQELGEQREENELLLLQLKQVQEELEHYFTKHRQLEDEQTTLKDENRKLRHQIKLTQQQLEQPTGILARLITSSGKTKNPQKLTYSDAELRYEQVNPDYEHLWISLKDATYGERYCPEWTFRVSCAGVTRDVFGKQPKLEIPEQYEQLLDHWFAESEDDHGQKLELRFALPNAMDTGVWKLIDTDDQAIIRSLLKQLPDILKRVEERYSLSSHKWQDWQQLVADMQRIHNAKAK